MKECEQDKSDVYYYEQKTKKHKDALEVAEKLASGHVNWFLDMVRPLMITFFMHGYDHGYEQGGKDER
jgi:hypothetical protein